MSKLSRAVKLILIVWLISLSFALPQALQFGIVQQYDMDTCQYKKVILEHSFELSTFLFFVTPMTLITVLYALIGCRLRASSMMKREISIRHRRNKGIYAKHGLAAHRTSSGAGDGVVNDNLVRCNNNGQIVRGANGGANGANGGANRRRNGRGANAHGQSSRRVLKMLVAVVVAFFICWAPFHAQRLVAIYAPNVNPHTLEQRPFWLAVYTALTYVSGILYYASTCINPLLYNIMSNKFREAFKETLSRTCTCCGHRDLSNGSPPGVVNTGSGRYSALVKNGDPRAPFVDSNALQIVNERVDNSLDAMKKGGSRLRLSEARDSSMSYSGNSQFYGADDLSQSQSQSCAMNNSFGTNASTMASPFKDSKNGRISTESGKLISSRKLLGNGKTFRRIWERLAKHNRTNSGNTNNSIVHNDISTSVSTHLTEVKIDTEPLNHRSPTSSGERSLNETCRIYSDNINNTEESPNGNNVNDCEELTCYMRELQRRDHQRR